jgi:hypothetical protein
VETLNVKTNSWLKHNNYVYVAMNSISMAKPHEASLENRLSFKQVLQFVKEMKFFQPRQVSHPPPMKCHPQPLLSLFNCGALWMFWCRSAWSTRSEERASEPKTRRRRNAREERRQEEDLPAGQLLISTHQQQTGRWRTKLPKTALRGSGAVRSPGLVPLRLHHILTLVQICKRHTKCACSLDRICTLVSAQKKREAA